ncbi:MAG: type II secretion system F family protein [Candidatus Hermodarchaeia archaeon]|jgi:flagellar protein FlaJ
MRRISKKTRQITGIGSVAVAISIIVVMIVLWLVRPEQGFRFLNELLMIGALIAIIPTAILDYQHNRWIDSIEDQLPVLVRGIAESQETGVTIVEALERVVESKMVRGPLADEVEKMTIQMSWGLSFEEALNTFQDRVNSSAVNRFCALVLEASYSGGRIRKVFIATSGFMAEMREMDRETSSQMRPYLIIVYTAFLVLVFTAIILVKSFFEPLQGTPQMISPIDLPRVEEYKDFFYRAMIISGIMGGLMAGKISGLRTLGGLKHAITQLALGYVIFFIFIPPNWMVVA